MRPHLSRLSLVASLALVGSCTSSERPGPVAPGVEGVRIQPPSFDAGVLVEMFDPNGAPDVPPRGLWAISPEGEVAQMIPDDWSVLAVDGTDAAMIAPARGDSHPVGLVREGEAGHSAILGAPPPCATASGTGKGYTVVRGPWSGGELTGALTRLSPAGKALMEDEGTFLGCPLWDPGSATVAYVRIGKTASVHIDGERSRPAIPVELPSGPVDDRATSTGWSPDGVLAVATENVVHILDGSRHIETRLGRHIRQPPNSRVRSRVVSWNPSGTLVAYERNHRIVVLSRAGKVVDSFFGLFRAWADDGGILFTPGEPKLKLRPVGGREPESVVVARFKQQVVTDPEGRWFAYEDPWRYRIIWFVSPEGRRRVRMPVTVHLVAAFGGSRIHVPVW